MKTSKLLIKQLVLIGHRKNYIVPFNPGVNIIYGDADTGKSSILRMINYLLGGKEIQLDMEIASSVKEIILETSINGSPYCIKRDPFNASRDIEIYSCELSELSKHFPSKYSPTLTKKDGEEVSFSEFFLNELNFPNVEIKQAPSRDDSATARLSIRDLFKFMYINQDAVGSRKILDRGNYVLETKNKEIFKYIFNTLDTNISDVESTIAGKTREKNQIQEKLEIVREFLRESKFENIKDIEENISTLNNQIKNIKVLIDDVSSRIINNSNNYNSYKTALNTINLQIKKTENNRSSSLINIERFTRLKNDYINDIKKLKSIKSSKELIGSPSDTVINCPLCDSDIPQLKLSELFLIEDNDQATQEINSLKNRLKELKSEIIENRENVDLSSIELNKLLKEQKDAMNFLDEEMADTITPYLTERDAVISKKSETEEKKKKLQNELKIVNQQTKLSKKVLNLRSEIDDLKDKLTKLKHNSPSIEHVIKGLSKDMLAYLEKIQIKNRTGISISAKTFLPVLRDTDYIDINSGGMRTIVSIGYFSILLKAKLNEDTNLPNLLMIDTVGKYLGKTFETEQSEDDKQEELSDPNKYRHIYEYLIDLAEEFEESNKVCQIILVDNDVPAEISEQYSGFVVAHYSSEGINDLPVGLIDDWDTFIQDSTN